MDQCQQRQQRLCNDMKDLETIRTTISRVVCTMNHVAIIDLNVLMRVNNNLVLDWIKHMFW